MPDSATTSCALIRIRRVYGEARPRYSEFVGRRLRMDSVYDEGAAHLQGALWDRFVLTAYMVKRAPFTFYIVFVANRSCMDTVYGEGKARLQRALCDTGLC